MRIPLVIARFLWWRYGFSFSLIVTYVLFDSCLVTVTKVVFNEVFYYFLLLTTRLGRIPSVPCFPFYGACVSNDHLGRNRRLFVVVLVETDLLTL